MLAVLNTTEAIAGMPPRNERKGDTGTQTAELALVVGALLATTALVIFAALRLYAVT